MAQCSTCGSNVSDQDQVCPDCGMELATVPQPEASPVPASVLPTSPKPADSPHEPVSALKSSAPEVAGLAKLTLRRAGSLTAEAFTLGEHVTIGRFDADTGPVDVDLGPLPEGAYLSRHHAEMWHDGSGQWFVRDLGSQNGTFVRLADSAGFQRVTQDQPISDGDEIAFGNARFEFRRA